MKWTLIFLLFVINANAQKVVKPQGNIKEHFSLTINKENYKEFVEGFINKNEYKQLWLNSIKSLSKDVLLANKGKEISAKIRILVSVNYDGKVYIESHSFTSSDESIINNNSIGIVVNKIRNDLRKIVKKKGVVTPAYNERFIGYVNYEVVIEQVWSEVL